MTAFHEIPMANNRSVGRPWLPLEEAKLWALLNDGLDAAQIAERLEPTRQAIYGRVQRFHKQRGPTSRTNGKIYSQLPID